ncbi:MAG: type I glutamate--ammonia ligase [Acidobacteria bacterium]|nr:type I glutamate--ammonia ligase [Acidobacteriota bacterium]
MSASDVLKFVKDEQVEYVDIRFTDLPGQWHHVTIPVDALGEEAFESGVGFDGSSLRGWASIHESDMLLRLDPSRYWIDPFISRKTVCLIADVIDPLTKQDYPLDPRGAARRAEAYLRQTGIADTVNFGPEAEFFVFDKISYYADVDAAGYKIESAEAIWSSRERSNGGYQIRHKEGYVPLPPLDTLHDFRSEVADYLKRVGINVECHHHEVATAGQCEIDFLYANLVKTADNVLLFKYTVKNLAKQFGKTATFMPKPMYGDNGNGMHCHQSLWKNGEPLFAGEHYAGLSQTALYYIGGLLKHAPSIVAFAAPTTNSYRRLVPGFEAPVNLAYSRRNRSAAVRIPMYSSSPKAKRLEFRPPDPSCNPYLAFAAMLLAGLDGIRNQIDPGAPLDKDIYDLSPEELKEVPSLPGSLDEAIDALEQDYEFLLAGEVFTEELLDRWIRYKRDREINIVRMRPSPVEFTLYYDI